MRSLQIFVFIVGLYSLTSCSTTTNPAQTVKSKVSIGTAEAGDTTVELLTDGKLETGLVPIYIKLSDASHKAITDANVTFAPMMSMSNGMSHTCPVFGSPVLEQGDVYHVDVVFQMPSSDVDFWSATVGINDTDAEMNDAVFDKLDVPDNHRVQTFTFTDPTTSEATRYVSSLNFIDPPKVGLNPVVFTLHTRQDMMTFPPVDDATLAIDPQMPSMGHGAAGSVKPTKTNSGRYEGQVSLSMAGSWDITVTVNRGDTVVGTPVFPISF